MRSGRILREKSYSSSRNISNAHLMILHSGGSEHWAGRKLVPLTNKRVCGEHSRFRDILSAGTRSLKRAGLRFVTDESMRADLRKEPRGHRRNRPSQMRES
jgi:hypothetical protein